MLSNGKLEQAALERVQAVKLEIESSNKTLLKKLSGLSWLMEDTCKLTPKNTAQYKKMEATRIEFNTLLNHAINGECNNIFDIVSALQDSFDSFLHESLKPRNEWRFWGSSHSGNEIISQLNTDTIKKLLNLLPRKNTYYNKNGKATYSEVKHNLDVSISFEIHG